MPGSVRLAGGRAQGRGSRAPRDGRPQSPAKHVATLTPIDLKEMGTMRHTGWSIAAAAIGMGLVSTACTASSASGAEAAAASRYAVALWDELKTAPAMIDAPANTP